MARWAFVLVCGFGCVAACAGCGPGRAKRFEVTGTVLYKGAPVSGAVVAFHPQAGGQIATGTTDAQGRFKLNTPNVGSGTTAGKHKVTVAKFTLQGGSTGAVSMDDALKASQGPPPGPAQERNELPAKYADPATSPLEQTVGEGATNDFKIELAD